MGGRWGDDRRQLPTRARRTESSSVVA